MAAGRRGFAGACLRLQQGVSTAHHDRDSCLLDLRGHQHVHGFQLGQYLGVVHPEALRGGTPAAEHVVRLLLCLCLPLCRCLCPEELLREGLEVKRHVLTLLLQALLPALLLLGGQPRLRLGVLLVHLGLLLGAERRGFATDSL